MIGPFQKIMDISQPVSESSACFPGDTPFSKTWMARYDLQGVMNLTQFTMSPHVGTHADAPLHIQGNPERLDEKTIGQLPLTHFMGSVAVLDLSPCREPISLKRFTEQWAIQGLGAKIPERILFKTMVAIRYDVFEETYASLSVELVEFLGQQGVQLVGIDTPSVDPTNSKTLDAHHCLLKHQMVWLENLDLTEVTTGRFFLVALPLKMMTLEASPVRAVLLTLE